MQDKREKSITDRSSGISLVFKEKSLLCEQHFAISILPDRLLFHVGPHNLPTDDDRDRQSHGE